MIALLVWILKNDFATAEASEGRARPSAFLSKGAEAALLCCENEFFPGIMIFQDVQIPPKFSDVPLLLEIMIFSDFSLKILP